MRQTLLAAIFIAATLAAAGAPVAAQTVSPVAVVDERVITDYDVEQRARVLLSAGAPRESVGRIAFEQLVDDAVRLAAADAEGIDPTSIDIGGAVASYAQQQGLSVGDVERNLQRAGASREALEDAIRAQVVWGEVVRRRFAGQTTPTEAEIDREIEMVSSGGAMTYDIAEIAIPDGGDPAAARARAREVVRALRSGADFPRVARQASAAPTASDGGRVGWTPAANLPPPLASALETLSPGQITEPIETGGQIVILQLIARRDDTPDWAAPQTLSLVEIRAEGLSPLAELSAELAGCGDAREIAADAGLEAREVGPIAAGDLPPVARRAVAGVSEGLPSAPVSLDDGAALYVVCAREGGPSPEAREALRRRLSAQRLETLANSHLQELRGRAVIDMRR